MTSEPCPAGRLLVTGATGLVGSHCVDQALAEGLTVRVLVRSESGLLSEWRGRVELAVGRLEDAPSLERAVRECTHVVHCAAKVGDWGPVAEYRLANVESLRVLTSAARGVERFVHISSLGVYEPRDHYGTDEAEPPHAQGLDGYTRSKVEAEQVIAEAVARSGFPATILRPGFLYGPRDRTVLPRLLENLRAGRTAYLGSRTKLMNNTYVANLVDAVFLALRANAPPGRAYNITDGRLVTKEEFLTTAADLAGYRRPSRTIPLGVARGAARVLEGVWRLRRRPEAPLLSQARIKFLGLNLDFSIDRAKRELGYAPAIDFQPAMAATIAWFQDPSRKPR